MQGNHGEGFEVQIICSRTKRQRQTRHRFVRDEKKGCRKAGEKNDELKAFAPSGEAG